ncbi:MAG: endopeptidase La [Spirochaetales bacterium]|nr:endopeptidase La [Spirochaetales bacterium]
MKLFQAVKARTGRREMPIVPLQEKIVFPHMVTPLFVYAEGQIKAIDSAMKGDRDIFLVPLKEEKKEPNIDDLHPFGIEAHILQMLKLPEGAVRLLVEGRSRGKVAKIFRSDSMMRGVIEPAAEQTPEDESVAGLVRMIHTSFKEFSDAYKKLPPEVVNSIERVEDPLKLTDMILGNMPIKRDKKLEFLKPGDPLKRIEELAVTLENEIELQNLQNNINSRVKKRMEKTQREYYLNEQLKEINKELGKEEEDPTGAAEFRRKIEEKDLPEEVENRVEKEIVRLSKLQPLSPEAGVLRTYLDWIFDLPWSERSEDNKDIERAEQILDEDHYDMEKPKDRVLDFIAVRQIQEQLKGPILCFVGPPGTGKTSLAKSVARALNRSFVRISLGGVRDEAEIRGHRKTYVGALPGKIIQSIRKAGSANPVFLLDEVDKMSSDYRGDPASALLEVLDPEQNNTFTDHYMEVPYDLSSVLFITTANSAHNIPYALRDRMETIEIPGYTEFEKLEIARRYLIPKQLEENGLGQADIKFQKPALLGVIRNYTMESGVRNLERNIANITRKLARKAIKAEGPEGFSAVVTESSLKKYLGPVQYQEDLLYREQRPGIAYGMAWTELGGTLLPVEATLLEGKGNVTLTGSLGDIMKESADIALSFLRTNARRFGIQSVFENKRDIHIHVPEGAIPKDGPSAGITITSAVLSAALGVPVKADYAMTGEITLTGRLLAVGGIKEKVLAAHRMGRTHILMPEMNKKDRDKIPQEVITSISCVFAGSAEEALHHLFPDELFRR